MKKNQIFLVAIVTVALVFVGLLTRRGDQKFSEPEKTADSQIKPSASIDQRRERFIVESHEPIVIKSEPSKVDPLGCREVWNELAGMDANKWGGISTQKLATTFSFGDESNLKQLRDTVNYSGRCSLEKKHPLKDISEHVEKECYPKNAGSSNSPSILSCMQAMLQLRFETIDYLTRDQPISQIQDPSVIGAKIYAQVMKPNEKRDPQKLFQLSQRALEIDPENIVAAEYLVKGAYLKQSMQQDSTDYRDLESSVQKLAESFPESPLAFEGQTALARQKKNFGLIRRLAEEAKQAGLEDKEINYHMAWASYLEGREDEAKGVLADIVQTHPDFHRAQASLDQIKSNESAPPEVKGLVSPFFDQLSQFEYSTNMAPIRVKLPDNISIKE